jgi:hypothetical protein
MDYQLIVLSALGGGVMTMAFYFLMKRRAARREVFVPELPYMIVGQPVTIGTELYILSAYQYDDKDEFGREHTMIFKSIPHPNQEV